MKQGLVEINTTGLISDFDDAILITCKQVESVNELIKVSTFYTRNNRSLTRLNRNLIEPIFLYKSYVLISNLSSFISVHLSYFIFRLPKICCNNTVGLLGILSKVFVKSLSDSK